MNSPKNIFWFYKVQKAAAVIHCGKIVLCYPIVPFFLLPLCKVPTY